MKMKSKRICQGLLLAPLCIALALSAGSASGTERFVSLSGSHAAPFLDWASAATNIQDAIDAAEEGDVIWVTNGVYATGGKVMAGDLTNRVALDKALTVRSVNGPFVTTIQGSSRTNGPFAVRCAWLTNAAVLSGFTIEGGATRDSNLGSSLNSGGGVWCSSTNSLIANCVIRSNTAYSYGAGVYQGTLRNCLISKNALVGNGLGLGGAGAFLSSLMNCTVVSNSGGYGVVQIDPIRCTYTNCIIYHNTPDNTASTGISFSSAVFVYCCSTPLRAGRGNFTNDPALHEDGMHLSSHSPCRSAGTNIILGTDLFGRTWMNPPSVGCAEWQPEPEIIVQPKVKIQTRPLGFLLGTSVNGEEPLGCWWTHDGIPVIEDERHQFVHSNNIAISGFQNSDAGGYQVIVSNSYGMATSVVANLPVHFVKPSNPNPVPPYSSWLDAATNIQDAIEAAQANEFVLVTNGIYDSGGKVMSGNLTNRVALDKALALTSVNGHKHTIIKGRAGRDQFTDFPTPGSDAVRCVWITNGAVLSGFTLTNGATRSSGNLLTDVSGGGAWCSSTNAIVANCVLIDNAAAYGGGIAFGILNNSLLYHNYATEDGGGAYKASLNSCTIMNNSTTYSAGDSGAGISYGSAHNCILLKNYGSSFVRNYSSSDLSYCLTSPLAPGIGNINADPQLLDRIHIAVNSPCYNAGNALYTSGTDLDGEPWNGTPSIGCDEVVESSLIGPLSVAVDILSAPRVRLPGQLVTLWGSITGQASRIEWSFGDGPVVTNLSYIPIHTWSEIGDYTVTFTAYNSDYPDGVSASRVVHVRPVEIPALQLPLFDPSGFKFEFRGQADVSYNIFRATNLTPPVAWQFIQSILGDGEVIQINDTNNTKSSQYYRISAF